MTTKFCHDIILSGRLQAVRENVHHSHHKVWSHWPGLYQLRRLYSVLHHITGTGQYLWIKGCSLLFSLRKWDGTRVLIESNWDEKRVWHACGTSRPNPFSSTPMFSFVTQKWKLVGLNLREKHRLHVIQVPKECLEQLQMSDICQKQIYTSQLEIAAEIDYIQAE